jgi:lactoylglutathione lyase
MINRVGTVCVFVSDQQRAKKFYTEKLGFQLKTEQPLYPGAANLWISVLPEGSETEVILYLPDENWQHYKQVVGQSQAITLDVSDMDALCADLQAKGVTFASEPDKQPWGIFATILDSENNRILLVEQPKH